MKEQFWRETVVLYLKRKVRKRTNLFLYIKVFEHSLILLEKLMLTLKTQKKNIPEDKIIQGTVTRWKCSYQ